MTPQTVMGPNGPQLAQFSKRGGVKVAEGMSPAEKLHFVNPGGTVGVGLDPYTGKPRSEGVAASLTPDQIQDNAIQRANLGLRAEQNRIAQDANNAVREVGGGQANREMGKLVADLRKEYNGLEPVKNFRSAAPIAASAANAPDTPAGDLDLIYAVGKVLDPGSVVREGEMNLVIKAGTPMQRFQGYARMISQGKGRLPPAQRQQLVDMLNGRMGQLKTEHDRAAAPYMQQAQRMQLPLEEVFGEREAPKQGGLTPAEAAELEALRKRFGRR